LLYKHRIDIYSFERHLIACTESFTQKKDVVRVLRPLSVCIGQTVVENRIPHHPLQQVQEIFSSPKSSYQLYGPPSLLFSGYRGSFPGGKSTGA
jgi:hypothetical protein